MIGGKVTEEGSGRPVVGAVVRFTPYASGPDSAGMSTPTASKSDGSFRLAAPPGPGYLVIQGPSDDFVLREMGAEGEVYFARPGSRRFYAHAYRFLDLKPESTERDVNLVLRRGITVKGQVVGPDGRPVEDASIFSRIIPERSPSGGWSIWNARGHGRVRDGRFELHGLDPDTEVPVYFLDAKHELGTTATFSGKSMAGGAATVRLEPCGTARARLVDPDGNPVRKSGRVSIAMIVTPGPPQVPRQVKVGDLFANEARLSTIDPTHYGTRALSDAQGRIVFPALIPARPTASSTSRRPATRPDPGSARSSPSSRRESLDLGDIRIAKPLRDGSSESTTTSGIPTELPRRPGIK